MKLIHQGLALLVLCALPSMARADQPLILPWVELQVHSCLAATFEAPPYETSVYLAGDSYRTTLITGSVVDSGLRDYDASKQYIRDAAEEMTAMLPQEHTMLHVALREWDAGFCRRADGETIRFNYHFECDVLPFTGHCLPPIQLVDPLS